MAGSDLTHYNKVLGVPHGIVLVTGPTGSGKTTTLYASLAQINDVERKIITIEDPIEYHLEGVNQIQVDTKTGLTFARGLRAILRHDPDVVLIGEIRDRETADIAVQASLTGHLVFSTLHTNDAPGAITRLIDMGVEPFLVASSLEMVVAQRLVRLICEGCKEPITIQDADRIRSEYGSDLPDALYHGRGCSKCGGTGYRGRKGIFELMPISDELRNHVTENASAQVIRRTAIEQGMSSLRQDGWRLIQAGMTTVEEVLRVTKDERAAQADPGKISGGGA
jgi:type II secretory ATPase GspE/PulE/Tfp pilus assembly ATPase PilB-like protein